MKDGLSSKCKTCVNLANKLTAQRLKEKDPAKFKSQASARSKRFYDNNPERAKEIGRLSAAKQRQDPDKLLKIQVRKRAGGKHRMSAEELEALFAAQDYMCAICSTQEPQGIGGANGWNIDHCHTTNKVRFILCNHCNRGLGAFKDSPQLLKIAADKLETFLKDV